MENGWYYTRQGQPVGPISREQLQQLAASHQLLPTDLVWAPGQPDWVPASSISGLLDTAPAAFSPNPAHGSYAAAPQAPREPGGYQGPGPVGGSDSFDDDLDQPRGRRRRKRRKEGLSSGAIAGLVIGGIFLVSVIVGVISGLSKSGFTGFGSPSSASFKDFSPDPKFKVRMPPNPKFKSQSVLGAELKMWIYEQYSGGYVVAFADMPILQGNFNVEEGLNGGRDGAVSNVKGTLLSEKRITFDGKYPGREIDIKLPKSQGYIRARFYLVGGRMYQMMSLGKSKSWIESSASTDFFNSLQIHSE
jgi:hypothetical protein